MQLCNNRNTIVITTVLHYLFIDAYHISLMRNDGKEAIIEGKSRAQSLQQNTKVAFYTYVASYV